MTMLINGTIINKVLFSDVALYSVVMFICSENTLFDIDACNKSFDITVSRDTTQNSAVRFQLLGVSFLPVTYEGLQASSDHTVQLRLQLKGITSEDFSEKCASQNNCDAIIETLQSAPFCYCCRRCGCTVLDRHL